MFLSERQKQAIKKVQSVVVQNPCSVSWDDMNGDEQTRFCSQCKLNVYNLSAMSDTEAAAVLALNGADKARPCVYFYRNKEGLIITDNCPRLLRRHRARLAVACLTLLTGIVWSLTQFAVSNDISTQGLYVDPRYGYQSNLRPWYSLNYDIARELTAKLTMVSFLICFFFPKAKHISVKRALVELVVLAVIPLLVYLLGIFVINNTGGLGGGS